MSGVDTPLPQCTLVALQGQFYFTSHKRQPQMWKAELLSRLQPSGFIDCRFNAWATPRSAHIAVFMCFVWI